VSSPPNSPVPDRAARSRSAERTRHGRRESERGAAAAASRSQDGDEPFRLPDWVTDLDVERPYLSALPVGVAGESLVLDWMAFLRARAGPEGTRDALAYYRAVGWISESVEASLADYAAGIDTETDADAELGTEAHRRSLLYVARLSVTRN
jgi:archaellum component FlaD/FlaE